VKGQIKQLKAFSIDFLVMEGEERPRSPPKHAIKARKVQDTLIGSILDENLETASLMRCRNPIRQTYLLCAMPINLGMARP